MTRVSLLCLGCVAVIKSSVASREEASMSLENFFVAKAMLFCLCLEGCFCFCMVFLALLAGVLWCGSAWFVVRFNVAKRDVYACCRALREKKFQKKKAPIPFSLLLPLLGG